MARACEQVAAAVVTGDTKVVERGEGDVVYVTSTGVGRCELEREVLEREVPVIDPVRTLCDLLGMDPLYVACEGRFVAVVPDAQAELAVETLQRIAPDVEAAVIGRVLSERPGQVSLRTRLGTLRHLPLLSGEQLPRIC